MNDDPIIQDTSRVDNYLRSRHRVAVLEASWRPALAGAAGALAIIGSVALGAWLVGPRYRYNEVEIPRVMFKDITVPNIVQRDVPVDHVVPHDVEIDIPRIVETPAPAPRSPVTSPPAASTSKPRTPAETRLVGSPEWRGADVRGRIVRADQNGFVLATEDGGETGFYPAKLGADGKPERNESMTDVIDPYLSDLACCRPSENGTYLCVALHEGREVPIPQIPITRERGRPA